MESLLGWQPRRSDLNLSGLPKAHDRWLELTMVDYEEWKAEVGAHNAFFEDLEHQVPPEFHLEKDTLELRARRLLAAGMEGLAASQPVVGRV